MADAAEQYRDRVAKLAAARGETVEEPEVEVEETETEEDDD